MKKIITISALVAGFAFAGSAGACNDLAFTTAMMKSGGQAQKAMTVAGNGDFSTGRFYVRLAKNTYLHSSTPCKGYLRTVRAQYGMALNYFDTGFTSIMSGNVGSATTSLTKGLYWIKQANAVMDAHGF